MARQDAVAIMGPPKRTEVHGSTEFLIYPTGSSDSAVLEFIPIAIVDGRVTGMGRTLYDTVVKAKTQSDLADRK